MKTLLKTFLISSSGFGSIGSSLGALHLFRKRNDDIDKFELISKYFKYQGGEQECFQQIKDNSWNKIEEIKVDCDSSWKNLKNQITGEGIVIRVKEDKLNKALFYLGLSKDGYDEEQDQNKWFINGENRNQPSFNCEQLNKNKKDELEIKCFETPTTLISIRSY